MVELIENSKGDCICDNCWEDNQDSPVIFPFRAAGGQHQVNPIGKDSFKEKCNKCNGQWKCSKHFEIHPCCGSTDYNRHKHTCINND